MNITPELMNKYKAHVMCDCSREETFLTLHPGQSHICPKCGRVLSVDPTDGRVYGLVNGQRTTAIRMEYKQGRRV